jgi:hypothetical protein
MTSISVDLDTLEEVRYKMRSFLVGEPTKTNVSKAPSSRREGADKIYTVEPLNLVYIPAYRLFETKRYNGPLVPKAPSSCREGAAALCCICLNNIRKGAMVVSMPLCGHLYHKACLFNWVDLSKNTFCPYCRQDDF